MADPEPDHCYAKLIEMFGDNLEMEAIYDAGVACNWNFSLCVETLLKVNEPGTQHESRERKTVAKLQRRVVDPRFPATSSSSGLHFDPATPPPPLPPGLGHPTTAKPPLSFVEQLQLGLGAMSFSDNLNHKETATTATNSHIDKLNYQIADGYKIMVLMRGLPGSGKSSLARKLLDEASLDPSRHIVSADQYFTDRWGNYNYDRTKLSEAHADCQNRVKALMMRNFAPIFVDNTNIQLWEMRPFCLNAVENGYIVQILEPTTAWSKNAEECYKRGTHGVPLATVQNMRRNYERIQNGQELLDHFSLPKRIQYQMREDPPVIKPVEEEPEPDVIKSFSPIQSTGDDIVIDSEMIVRPDPFENYNWTAHEREVSSFWKENILPSAAVEEDPTTTTLHSKPKPQRLTVVATTATTTIATKSLADQMLSALKDDNAGDRSLSKKDKCENPLDLLTIENLQKHRKGCRNENETFAEVRLAYPMVSVQYLWDLFEKCKGDANWMMNILLNESAEKHGDGVNDDGEEDFHCDCETSCWSAESPESVIVEEERVVSKEPATTPPNRPQPQRQRKKSSNQQRQQPLGEEAEQIKRQIEESFVIGDEFYTANMKRVREWKSKKRNPGMMAATPTSEETEASSSAVSPPEMDGDEEDNEPDSVEDSKVFEFRLGSEFIGQLETMFSGTSMVGLDSQKFRPNVFMTKSLAKEIYHLWVESMMYQLEEQKIDALTNDEEIARLLQTAQLEDKKGAVRGSFEDVTQMAYAMHTYRSSSSSSMAGGNGNNEWASAGLDLAVKLKRQKLYEIFPDIQKQTIDDILRQHNDNYDRVMETLRTSSDENTDQRLVEQQNQLILAAKYESQKVPEKSSTRLTVKPVPTEDEVKKDALREFEENRNMAMHHHQFRMECYQKAREASQKRNSEVAYYYLQIAKLHHHKVEHYNQLAANSIVHDLTHNKSELLDLHYLLVHEALSCLEVFLDSHISRLRRHKQPYKQIFLITGRGLHSAGGIPTIKMNVKNYLTKRGLKFTEVNPGLLRVRIYSNSRTTEQF